MKFPSNGLKECQPEESDATYVTRFGLAAPFDGLVLFVHSHPTSACVFRELIAG
jgi:hypothetical protein